MAMTHEFGIMTEDPLPGERYQRTEVYHTVWLMTNKTGETALAAPVLSFIFLSDNYNGNKQTANNNHCGDGIS